MYFKQTFLGSWKKDKIKKRESRVCISVKNFNFFLQVQSDDVIAGQDEKHVTIWHIVHVLYEKHFWDRVELGLHF